VLLNETLGSYRIERPLGRGGMGEVFLAYDTVLHRHVALKVVAVSRQDETSRANLLREARNAAALSHPNICTIYEVGSDDRLQASQDQAAFIAMEFVDGASIRDRLAAAGPFPVATAIEFGIQIADGLAYAHDRHVVHRDLKAANVIVTDTGRVKIVDFGLARRSDAMIAQATTMATFAAPGTTVGTPYAMAPEQVRGEPADTRSDIWALGVLLQEMVSGVMPFNGPTTPELFSAILRDAPAALPASVPVPVRALIGRCLEKNPAERYQHANEVRAALDAVRTSTRVAWSGVRPRLSRRSLLAATGVLVAAAVVGPNMRRIREWLAPGEPQSIRLAVLPFENLTGSAEQQYLSDGLTEEMIARLGRLHPQRLRVIARTSSMRYRDRATAVDQIGRELNVDYVLEGSTRSEGSRVRITAALIRARDQQQRWSGTFERELSGILSLQTDVAVGVARSLALALLPAEQAQLAGPPLVNPDAYSAYLKALREQATLNAPNLDRALRHFEEALAADPNYALAYAGIAGVWIGRQQIGLTPRRDAAPKIREAIARALELDDTLGAAHFRRAEMYAWTDWNWPLAGKEFERAGDLNPNETETRSLYADYLAVMGRPDEALVQIRRAVDLDPLNTQTRTFLGRALMFARRYDEALAAYREVMQAEPNQQVALGNVRELLHAMGKYDDALAADRNWAAKTRRGGPEVAQALDTGFQVGGYSEAMRRTADLQATRVAEGTTSAFNVAQFYMRAGDGTRALDWLEKSLAAHDPGLPYLKIAPLWDPVRNEPRYRAIVRAMNLAQ
jgi:eukaryotic-like serine/threonine-protein kinase